MSRQATATGFCPRKGARAVGLCLDGAWLACTIAFWPIRARRCIQSKPCDVDSIFQLGNIEAQRVAR